MNRKMIHVQNVSDDNLGIGAPAGKLGEKQYQ